MHFKDIDPKVKQKVLIIAPASTMPADREYFAI